MYTSFNYFPSRNRKGKKKKKNGIVINNGETNTGWPLDDNIIV